MPPFSSSMSTGASAESESFSLIPKFRTCKTDGCSARLSQLSLDPHSLCVACRGCDCNMSARCRESADWSESTMGEYLAHQVKLCKKRKARKDESVKSQAKKSVSSQSAGSPSDSKTPGEPPRFPKMKVRSQSGKIV